MNGLERQRLDHLENDLLAHRLAAVTADYNGNKSEATDHRLAAEILRVEVESDLRLFTRAHKR